MRAEDYCVPRIGRARILPQQQMVGRWVQEDERPRLERRSPLSLIHKYYCEICGAEKRAVNNWFMAEVMPNGMLLSHWREETAQTAGMHHFCGEAHVQVFVSRYLSSPASFVLSKRPALVPEDKGPHRRAVAPGEQSAGNPAT